MPTDPYPAQPEYTGHTLRGSHDRYVVRWEEKATRYARYFANQDDADTFLLYVKHYDPNGYAASTA